MREKGLEFIQKPVETANLLSTVRKALDSAVPEAVLV